MLTEDFLKIILKYIFCEIESPDDEDATDPDNYKSKTKTIVFNNIKTILDHYDNKEKPINIIELFSTVKILTEKIIHNNYAYNTCIIKDSLNISETIMNYINFISEKKITYYEYIQIIYHISYRDKYVKMFKEKDEYVNFIKSIEDGKFLDINKTVQQYEELLNRIYFDFSLNKNNLIDNNNLLTNKNFPTEISIDNNISDIFSNIRKYYSAVTSVRSGFKSFDEHFSLNGFESGRIYLGASKPGFGKSLWLLSSLVKSCKFYDTKEGEKELLNGKKNLYIYITAENQIYETLIRYISMVVESKNINLRELLLGNNINDVSKELYFKNSVAEIKYVPAYNTTTGDIMVLIDKIKAKYDKEKYELRCIYVDYMDLIKPMNVTDLYRLELGFVTMELKNISIKYNTPIVTVTQINNYERKESPDLSLLKESKSKGEHADCVFIMQENFNFLQYSNDNEKIIDVNIIKNRGYKKGVFHIYFNYEYKKLIGCTEGGSCDEQNEYIKGYIDFAKKYKSLNQNIMNNNNILKSMNQQNKIQTFSKNNYNKSNKQTGINNVYVKSTDDMIITDIKGFNDF